MTGSRWQGWVEPRIDRPSNGPAPGGVVFGWAEALVRALTAHQLACQLYGAVPSRQLDYDESDICEFCLGDASPRNAAVTAGGWRVCRRCAYRVRALARLDPMRGIDATRTYVSGGDEWTSPDP